MPTTGTFFKAWLCFFLLATFGGFGVGMILGMIVGMVMAASGADLQQIQTLSGFLGFIVAMPISFVCFRWAVVRFILPTIQTSSTDTANTL